MLADTPKQPYYAVIFSSVRTDGDNGYTEMATRMVELASGYDGFLGLESAREEIGITVSYWRDLDSISRWKGDVEHLAAQQRGSNEWYSAYRLRVALVERDVSFTDHL